MFSAQIDMSLVHIIPKLPLVWSYFLILNACLGKKTMYVTVDYIIQKLNNCWYEYYICDFM